MAQNLHIDIVWDAASSFLPNLKINVCFAQMSIIRKIPASTPPRRFLPKFFKTGKTGKAGKACGGNNSPRAPLVPPKAAPFGGAGVQGLGELPKMAGCRKGWDCEGWRAWQAMFGLRTQCRCVLSDPPAVADSCPAFAGQSCQRKRFPDVFGRNTEVSAAKVNPKVFSQRSGERGRHQEPAPTTASSRNSLPALSAAAVVQVLCPHSVSCANGQLRHSGEGKGRPRRRQQAAGIHFRR